MQYRKQLVNPCEHASNIMAQTLAVCNTVRMYMYNSDNNSLFRMLVTQLQSVVQQ